MRLGQVIGRVTLSQTVPAYEGGRFLVVSPFDREHFQQGGQPPEGLSKQPSLVVYDDIGGGSSTRWRRTPASRAISTTQRTRRPRPWSTCSGPG